MKKKINDFFLVFSVFFCIMLTMSCDEDDTTGLNGDDPPTPENIFAGGEWELIRYEINTYFDPEANKFVNEISDELSYHLILSFTNNAFTVNTEDKYYGKSTCTGTYSLSYEPSGNENGAKVLTLVSNKPEYNGQVGYWYYNESGIRLYIDSDELSEAGDLLCTPHGTTPCVALPRKMSKIN